MSTDAEKAQEMGITTVGVLRDVFGAAINPQHGLYEFPDGSTGRFSPTAKKNMETGKMGYPFESRERPLEFPNAKADASVDEPVRKAKPSASPAGKQAKEKEEESAPSAPGRKITVLTRD